MRILPKKRTSSPQSASWPGGEANVGAREQAGQVGPWKTGPWRTAAAEAAVREAFQLAEPVSIDYGIMEKVTDIMVLPGNFGWDDVGSWPALERTLPADDHGNVVVGNHVGIDTTGCIVHSGGKLVATIGVEDLIVVETDDVTLICKKESAQEVKKVLVALRQAGETRYL